MSKLKDRIEQDLKTAMLAHDTPRVDTLRGLKSAILYEEVAKNSREQGLSDDEVIQVLAKESKKRQESADLYQQGNDQNRREAELSEKAIIDIYLPQQLSEADLTNIIKSQISVLDAKSLADLGRVIGAVKKQVGATADGANIARIAKGQLGQLK